MTKSWKHFFRTIPIGRSNRCYHTTHRWSLIARNMRLEWFLINFWVFRVSQEQFLTPLGWKSVVNRLKGWTSSGVKNFSMWFQYMTKSWKHFLRIIPIGRNNRYYHTTRGSSLIVRNICLKWFTMNFVVLKKWFRRGFVLPGAQKVYWVSEGVGLWVARKYFLDGSRT